MKEKCEFFMLMGLPGAGKTDCAKFLESKGFHSYTLSRFRREEFGDPEAEGDKNRLFKELHQRIREDLENGISCVYDATNIDRRHRMALLQKLDNLDVKRTCVLFLLPEEECKKRNAQKNIQLPDEAYDNILRQFHTPYYYEGWNQICIATAKNCTYRFPIEETYIFDQKNSHHSRKLFDHMHATACWLSERNPERKDLLCKAALSHDIGKLYTQSFTDAKGNPSADAHYYCHENVGAYLYLLQEFYSRYTSVDDVLYVANLINWHMRPFTAWRHSDKAREKDRKLIGEEMYQDILLLHEADKACH